MSTNKKQSCMINVLTIVFSQILVKLLGLVYRMVITNVKGFGDLGNGYYNFGYQIYTLLLAISSVGIPNAVAKLVAEREAKGDHKSSYDILKSSLLLFGIIGATLSALLFFSAPFVSRVVLKVEGAVYTLRALSPAIFFVSVSSVIRGYFGGLQNMNATATSQVLEQFLKSTLTVVIVMAMTGSSPEYMSAGANLATTISCVLSFIYLYIFFKKRKKGIKENIRIQKEPYEKKKFSYLAKTILWVSIPISLSSIVTALNRVLDSVTVVRGIEHAFASKFSDYASLNLEAVRLSGILSKSDVLINLPLALNIAFATALVPNISSALALNDYKTAQKRISFSVLMSIVIALPATFGYIALSQPIFFLLYPNASGGASVFALSALTIIFTAVAQTTYGALQGMGKVFVPALSLLTGGAVKLILNLILIPNPNINIYGAPIGSIACQMVALTICMVVLKKNIGIKLSFVKFILKPVIATAVMYGVVSLSYSLIKAFSSNLATLVSIVLGVAVYLILIVIFKVFENDEYDMIPFGKYLKRL